VVDVIRERKNDVLDYMDKALDKYGPDKMDVAEMDKLADIVKDLAEAEKSCWEAEYYKSVTDAMHNGSYGYMPEGSWQYDQTEGRGRGRYGYDNPMGRYSSRRGYHGGIDAIRAEMQSATPDERERLKRELRQMLDS
jgi:hypothetical protein